MTVRADIKRLAKHYGIERDRLWYVLMERQDYYQESPEESVRIAAKQLANAKANMSRQRVMNEQYSEMAKKDK